MRRNQWWTWWSTKRRTWKRTQWWTKLEDSVGNLVDNWVEDGVKD